MAVDKEQIFIAVEVHITKLRGPTEQGSAVDPQTAHGGAVGEEAISDTF